MLRQARLGDYPKNYFFTQILSSLQSSVSVVPSTARFLTTRMPGLKAQPIRQNPSARLGYSADSRVPGNRLKMILK
jgi:hypothetical protein